jgi:hypothetical protein
MPIKVQIRRVLEAFRGEIRMRIGTILVGGASLVAFTAPASALTFDWSFDNSAFGQPDQFVTGTISGLDEGVNDAHGLTVTVDSMPGSEMLGQFNYLFASGTFTVTDGQITDAAAHFDVSDFLTLWFGTPNHPSYAPTFISYDRPSFDEFIVYWDYSSINPEQFSLAASPTPAPEPASWTMMVGGFGLAGTAIRRRRKVALSFG